MTFYSGLAISVSIEKGEYKKFVESFLISENKECLITDTYNVLYQKRLEQYHHENGKYNPEYDFQYSNRNLQCDDQCFNLTYELQ